MTANETIDGVLVSRELLERCARVVRKPRDETVRRRALSELRALLDAPTVERKPFGWFRTPKDCPLQGMFLHYDPEHGERDIQNALDFGFTVKRLYETQAAQPQGEPVAWAWVDEKGEHGVTLRWDVAKHLPYFVKPLYSEQPASVEAERQTILELQHELAILHDAFKLYPGAWCCKAARSTNGWNHNHDCKNHVVCF